MVSACARGGGGGGYRRDHVVLVADFKKCRIYVREVAGADRGQAVVNRLRVQSCAHMAIVFITLKSCDTVRTGRVVASSTHPRIKDASR